MRDAVRLRAVAGPWGMDVGAGDDTGFAAAVATALAIERRESKGIVGRSDLRRYHLASVTIERSAANSKPAHGIPDLLLDARSCIPALAASVAPGRDEVSLIRGFFTPEMTASLASQDLALPEPLRGSFGQIASAAAAKGCGIVAMFETDSVGDLLELTLAALISAPADRKQVEAAPEQASQARERTAAADLFAGEPGRQAIAMALREAIAQGLDVGGPLVVGSQSHHEVLAEALRDVADTPSPAMLRIAYLDGSEADPFPIGPWTRGPAPEGRSIRVGLMSMRHTELDADVEGYWFRNYLVSTTRTLAETDQWCTQHSEQQLVELTGAGIRKFEVVHTGFEPAVVGFYRAVSRWLRDASQPAITVRPIYLRRFGSDLEGRAWQRPQA